MLRATQGQEQNHTLLVEAAFLPVAEEGDPSEEEVAEVVSANEYIYNEQKYSIEVIKKNNKNTYLKVKDNKIVVTTSYLTTSRQITKLIEDNTTFINKALDKSIKKKEDDTFKLFGNSYDIIYGPFDTEINNNKIYTKDEKTFNKYYTKYITNIYSERLNYWYNIFEENIPYPNLKIRKMTSRWGVCNIKNHNVTLNSELSKYDISALDYVIVHELSHFIHHNHSKDFWLLVSKYCPNYKDIRKMLRS